MGKRTRDAEVYSIALGRKGAPSGQFMVMNLDRRRSGVRRIRIAADCVVELRVLVDSSAAVESTK